MLVLKGGILVDPVAKTEEKKDLLIGDGRIIQMAEAGRLRMDGLSVGKEDLLIELNGKYIAPGLVDCHVHFRDPGFTEKEDVFTGAGAAAAGGYTRVVMMGNTNPHPDQPETIREMLEKGKRTGIHVYTCGNVTKGMRGEELCDFRALKEAGAVLLSDDGKPILQKEIMQRACEEARKADLMISLHEEDPAYITDNGINGGEVAGKRGLVGSPREAEISMVERDLAIAEETGAELTIQHISAAESVELVRRARKTNPRVHAEATPHHFSLTEEAIEEYGTLAKVNPPLRLERDRLAILEGLRDGTIEMIATDHAPHTVAEKEKPFREAPSGMIGLETALSLGIKYLVQTGVLTLPELIYKMSVAPAKITRIGGTEEAGEKFFYEGRTADLCVFDVHAERVADHFVSKACNTPFRGWTLPGEVLLTVCGGKPVYRAGSLSLEEKNI